MQHEHGFFYELVLFLHILTVIVGFGAIAVNSIQAGAARRRAGSEGLATQQAGFYLSNPWVMWFLYAIPILGIVLILLSDGEIEFSEPWLSASFLLYIIAIGVSHSVLLPSSRRLQTADETDVVVTETQARENLVKKVFMSSAILNLSMLAILALMVWQPGADPGHKGGKHTEHMEHTEHMGHDDMSHTHSG